MDEIIEVYDVNGNLVRVSFYGTLAALGAGLAEGQSKSCKRADGRDVEVRLAERFDPGTLAD